jgi:hypothetical protein
MHAEEGQQKGQVLQRQLPDLPRQAAFADRAAAASGAAAPAAAAAAAAACIFFPSMLHKFATQVQHTLWQASPLLEHAHANQNGAAQPLPGLQGGKGGLVAHTSAKSSMLQAAADSGQ